LTSISESEIKRDPIDELAPVFSDAPAPTPVPPFAGETTAEFRISMFSIPKIAPCKEYPVPTPEPQFVITASASESEIRRDPIDEFDSWSCDHPAPIPDPHAVRVTAVEFQIPTISMRTVAPFKAASAPIPEPWYVQVASIADPEIRRNPIDEVDSETSDWAVPIPDPIRVHETTVDFQMFMSSIRQIELLAEPPVPIPEPSRVLFTSILESEIKRDTIDDFDAA
jgi:hypothetical protein